MEGARLRYLVARPRPRGTIGRTALIALRPDQVERLTRALGFWILGPDPDDESTVVRAAVVERINRPRLRP